MASDQSGGVFQPQDVPTEFTLLKNPEQLETPTVDVKPRQDENLTMRAVEFHAKMQTFALPSLTFR